MMQDLSSALKRYQQCIGAYDQHDWERSVEQKLLEGLGGPVPKKAVKLLPQLIDVDLIRGSAFGKAKPLLSFVGVTWLGVKAALLFPFWWSWWVKHIGSTLVRLVCLAYCLQMGVLAHYLAHTNRGSTSTIDANGNSTDFGEDGADWDEAGLELLTGTEVGSCIILMISLSVLHAHMTSTQRQASTVQSASPTSDSSASSSSGCSSTGCWSTPYQTANSSTVGSSGKKTVRQKPSTHNPPVSRWRRAISEDPTSFRPRPPSVVLEKEKETLSGDEIEDEAEDEDEPGSETLQRSGSKKARLKTSRQLLRIRRKSCGTMTQGTTDIDGDVDKNSSCDSSECPSSFSVRPPLPDSTTNNCDAPPKAASQQRREKQVSGGGSKARGGRSTTSEVDYWSGATTNSEEDCCNCTSTELDDDDEVVGSTGGSGGKRLAAGADKPNNVATGINSSAFFQESLFFPFEYSGAVSFEDIDPSWLKMGRKKVSCMIWSGASGEAHKADLSVLDISSAIVRKVEFSSAWDSADYLWIGVVLSSVLAFIPAVFRFLGHGIKWTDFEVDLGWPFVTQLLSLDWLAFVSLDWPSAGASLSAWMFRFSPLCMLVLLRFILAFLTFFLLSVAERTFKRRYMLAKMFHCLTSARRAKRWDLPHFRLSKVRNIKSWLSVRSYLKRHGPQRSVDVIVSAAFLATLALMTGICADMLRSGNGKDSDKGSPAPDNEESSLDLSTTSGPVLASASTIAYTDAVVWCLGLAVFLLRYMTLGVKINSKYRDISVLITEQINLYLRMEQKPHKKDQLILANNVLKLAADLIKELESPFKISGLSANPILYNVTKMVVLSAFSAVLTEMLGFKLKLYKLKFKA